MSHPDLEKRSADSKHVAIVVLWLVFGIVGCRPAPPPPAALPPIPQTQAPTTAAQAYALPVNSGIIAGRVLYTGPTVQLIVLDMLGREVSVLVREPKDAGEYSVTFDGTDLPSGVYFYRIEIGHASATLPMMLVK